MKRGPIKAHPLILCLLLGLLPLSAWGEASIYRWVDENGKVHFGDRPPAGQSAEDISDSAKQVNEDTSSSERRKLERIFAQESKAERQAREQKARQQAQQQEQHQQRCEQARKRMRFIQEEKFYLVDKSGQTQNIKESQRDDLVKRLQAQIQQHCQ